MQGVGVGQGRSCNVGGYGGQGEALCEIQEGTKHEGVFSSVLFTKGVPASGCRD